MGPPKQGHGAGNADRPEGAGGLPPGQGFTGGLQQVAGSAAARGDLPAIQYLQIPAGAVPVQKKAAAPEAGALGLHHREHRLGGHQGIHRMAAGREHRQGRFAGIGMGGDHHG